MLLSQALRIKKGDVVALTGGGGKTALMFRLAGELAAAGGRVITTMTTKIFQGQMERAPAHLVLQDDSSLGNALPGLLDVYRHVMLAGGVLAEQGKVYGLPTRLIDAAAALTGIDAVLVEADGSRRLPFKAPAAHEPVVPPSATILCPVAGLDVIGQPLAETSTHRPELVAQLAGVSLCDRVTPEVVATVLAHREGGAKGLPDAAKLVPVLNKADLPGALEAGREVARDLLASPLVDSVVLAAAETDEPAREVWGRVGAVVLAAGAGRRYGSLKQVQAWGEGSLVGHVVRQALHCPDIERVVVTTGAGADRVAAAVREAGAASVVYVPDWELGQSRSVVAGLDALVQQPGATGMGRVSAVLFLLADQPGITPALLSALIHRHRTTLAPVVAPRFVGRRGNPVLFDAATFPEFAALAGDIGARPVIKAHDNEIAWVDWPSPEILKDIDTPADYHAAQ